MSYKPFEQIVQAMADGQLEEVSLSHRGLDDSSCVHLARAIEAPKTRVTVIDLQGNNITHVGVATLCEALKKNQTVVELGFASNSIDDNGAKELLALLNVNPNVRAITLTGNGVSAEVLKEIEFRTTLNTQPLVFKEVVPRLLAGEAVDEVDVSETHGQLSFPLLANVLSKNESVRRLNLTAAGLGDMGADIVGAMLKTKKGLEEVILDNNGISLHGVRNLSQSGLKENACVKRLSLRANKVGDDAARLLIQMLRENDCLTELDVSDNAVSQSILESLTYNLHLNQQPIELKRARQGVEANDPNLTDIMFAWIPNMTLSAYFLAPVLKNAEHVVNLVLSNARIGDSGAQDLSTVLRSNRSLRVLEVANNDITSDGAAILADALRVNKCLTELNIANNEVGNDGASALAAMLQVNDTLVVMNIELNPCSDELVDELEGLLLVNQQPRALKTILPLLEGNSDEGAVVDFSQYDGERFFNDNSALVLSRGLRGNDQVREIDLTGNNITDLGATYLAEILATSPSLTVLNIADNSVGDRGGVALAQALRENTTLRSISLKGNCCGEATAEAFLDMLTVNHFLNDVNLEMCRVSKAVLNEVRIACAINLQPQSLKLMLNQLRQKDPELRELMLQADEDDTTARVYDDTAVTILCHEMTDNENILLLDLSDNKIGTGGCKALGDWLARPTTKLQELRLYGNSGINDDGARELAEAFTHSTTLARVDLRGTNITDDGVLALSDSLKKNDSIKSILITKEVISVPVAALLTRELAINRQPLSLKAVLPGIVSNDPTLVSIDLPRSDVRVLDDMSCQLLAHALTKNTHVQRIDLSGNEITTEGVEYLADMLEDNNSIAEVHLEENRIDDAGAQMLIKALSVNYSIRYLGLEGNPITEPAAREVGYLMRVNNSPYSLKQVMRGIASNDPELTHLNFDGAEAPSKFSDDAVRILCSLLVSNHVVTHVSLANNDVTDEGASFIADLLRVNTTLTHLDLFGNQVTEDGADVLFAALKANSTLVSLGLGKNPIPPKSDIWENLTGVLTVNGTQLIFPKKKKGEFKKRPKMEELDDTTLLKDTEYMHDVEDQVWVDGMIDCPSHAKPKILAVPLIEDGETATA